MEDETDAPTGAPEERTPKSPAVPADHHKAVVQRWIEAFNARDDQGEANARTPNYVAHAPVGLEPAPMRSEAWTQFLGGFVEGFPDLHITVEDIFCEGDLVAARVAFKGTHTGSFQGLPPTNRQVAFSGIEIDRMVDGKVEEHWFQLDGITLLQQLGMVVMPGPRLLPRLLVHQAKKLRSRLPGSTKR